MVSCAVTAACDCTGSADLCRPKQLQRPRWYRLRDLGYVVDVGKGWRARTDPFITRPASKSSPEALQNPSPRGVTAQDQCSIRTAIWLSPSSASVAAAYMHNSGCHSGGDAVFRSRSTEPCEPDPPLSLKSGTLSRRWLRPKRICISLTLAETYSSQQSQGASTRCTMIRADGDTESGVSSAPMACENPATNVRPGAKERIGCGYRDWPTYPAHTRVLPAHE